MKIYIDGSICVEDDDVLVAQTNNFKEVKVFRDKEGLYWVAEDGVLTIPCGMNAEQTIVTLTERLEAAVTQKCQHR
jgi:hypothetical protein